MSMLISFVIPVFNIDSYIKRCVESIFRLDVAVDSFEIILINDGSTDSSDVVCKDLRKQFSNIKYYETENMGVSHARNLGIEKSSGKFIAFVDGDDFFISTKYFHFIEIAEKNNIDVVRFLYKVFNEKRVVFTVPEYSLPKFHNTIMNGTQYLKLVIQGKQLEVVPWLGFYRKDYLIKNHLLFDEKVSYEEDQLFFLECLLRNKDTTIYHFNDYVYAYSFREGSVTKTPTYRQIEDIVYVVKKEDDVIHTLRQKDKKHAKKYQSASFYQLTSIYGRLNKQDRIKTRKLVGFKMRFRMLFHPYRFYQFRKLFLFAFFPFIIDFYYYQTRKKHE